MHANPLRGRRCRRAEGSTFLESIFLRPDLNGLDASILEERTLFSASPIVLGDVELNVHEDAPETHMHLPDLFNLDDSGQSVQYQLIDDSNPNLFRSLNIDASDDLVLSYSPDLHGTASLMLQANDALGNVEQLTLNVKLIEVNDTPTMKDVQAFTETNAQAGFTVIDLFAAFDDKEDADRDLTYRIDANTNPSLFASTTFDLDRGWLVLQHAAGQSGTAELTLVATDSGGLSVGMEISPDFKVYDQLYGDPGVSAADVGLAEINLMTGWYFFEYGNDGYDYSRLDVDKYERILSEYSGDPSVPMVVDIENSYYTNTPEGRDRFAEVLDIFNEIHPDLDVGIYRFLPERSFYFPVNHAIAQDHLEMGIETWYTARADRFQTNYENWIDGNELYRTEPVSDTYGGGPLVDHVDSVHASLYTALRNAPAPLNWQPATIDSVTNRLAVDGISFDGIEVVRIEKSADTTGDVGLVESTDYYVIDFEDNSFQLARTPNGDPIDFSVDSIGDIFVGAMGPDWENPWHDAYVKYWKVYAEENLAEAQKYDKPVYAWLSPSLRARAEEYFGQDFFRWQMEIVRPYVDGIVIYEPSSNGAGYADDTGWWAAMTDFVATLDQPAGTTTITIRPESHDDNRVPIAVSDHIATPEDTSITFSVASLLANDRDLDGDPLTATAVNLPSHGSLVDLGNGNWKYTPNASFSGEDSFQYQAFDGQDYSNLARVNLTVTGTNLVPVANDDSISVVEDQPLTLAIATLLRNDTDADGDDLRFILHEGPRHGTLSQQANGALIYRTDANFNGTDQFTYWVDDGISTSTDPATVTLNVQAVNDRPVAVADQLTTAEDEAFTFTSADLLANDVDAEDDALAVQMDGGPVHGQLTLLADGRYQYTPDLGFAGSDELTYRVNDGQLDSLTTLVRIDVLAKERALKATADDFSVAEDQPLVLDPDRLLANDIGAKAGNVEVELVDGPVHGTVRWTLDGNIVYVPAKDYFGLDRFNYRIASGGEQSEVVSVHIHVKAQNDAPVARPDEYTTVQGSTLNSAQASVIDNDTDVENDALRAVQLVGPQNGFLSLKRDGTFVYRPRDGFSGIDSFQYRLIDEHGAATVARAIIRVSRAQTSLNGFPLLLEAVPNTVLFETSPGPNVSTNPTLQSSITNLPGSNVAGEQEDDQQENQLASTGPYADLLARLGLLAR